MLNVAFVHAAHTPYVMEHYHNISLVSDHVSKTSTVVPRPLSNDPRFTQCIYRYSRASKRFVEV